MTQQIMDMIPCRKPADTRRFSVIDRRTGEVVKTFAKMIHAHHTAQHMDLAHGAARYSLRTVSA